MSLEDLSGDPAGATAVRAAQEKQRMGESRHRVQVVLAGCVTSSRYSDSSAAIKRIVSKLITPYLFLPTKTVLTGND